ncbi:MAG: DUF2934 domain-containing protein [Methylobacter sp.]
MQASFNPIYPPHTVGIDLDKFREMVAERAYCKAEKRGFTAGHEMEDWLEAEEELRNQCDHWFQDVE